MSKKTETKNEAVEEKNSGLNYHDCLNWLQLKETATNEVTGFKALHWLVYCGEKLKTYETSFNLLRAKIPGIAEFDNEMRKAAKNNQGEIFLKHQSTVEAINKLLSEPVDVYLRPFKGEWLEQAGTSPALMKILTSYNLLDDPSIIEKLLYGDDKK